MPPIFQLNLMETILLRAAFVRIDMPQGKYTWKVIDSTVFGRTGIELFLYSSPSRTVAEIAKAQPVQGGSNWRTFCIIQQVEIRSLCVHLGNQTENK